MNVISRNLFKVTAAQLYKGTCIKKLITELFKIVNIWKKNRNESIEYWLDK